MKSKIVAEALEKSSLQNKLSVSVRVRPLGSSGETAASSGKMFMAMKITANIINPLIYLTFTLIYSIYYYILSISM